MSSLHLIICFGKARGNGGKRANPSLQYSVLSYKVRKRAKNKKKNIDDKIAIKVCYEHCCEPG